MSQKFSKNLFIVGFLIFILIVGGLYFFMTNNTEKKSTKEDGFSENPIVVLETEKGDIEIELFLDKAPITAGNFKKLVEEGFYDGVRFHRVINDFIIQAGDPLSKDLSKEALWGTGGPGYAIEDEFVKGLSNVRGTISMANSGPNTGGSQFFINMVDNEYLDFDKPPFTSKHPVFGRVIEGMDIAENIAKGDVIIRAYIK